jgi:hypothetical protein
VRRYVVDHGHLIFVERDVAFVQSGGMQKTPAANGALKARRKYSWESGLSNSPEERSTKAHEITRTDSFVPLRVFWWIFLDFRMSG